MQCQLLMVHFLKSLLSALLFCFCFFSNHTHSSCCNNDYQHHKHDIHWQKNNNNKKLICNWQMQRLCRRRPNLLPSHSGIFTTTWLSAGWLHRTDGVPSSKDASSTRESQTTYRWWPAAPKEGMEWLWNVSRSQTGHGLWVLCKRTKESKYWLKEVCEVLALLFPIRVGVFLFPLLLFSLRWKPSSHMYGIYIKYRTEVADKKKTFYFN